MPTSATLFSLIYDAKIIIRLELEIPSLHVSLKNFIPNEESHQARLDQLTLLDERRINAIKHHKVYQEHRKRAFNKKIQLREFHINDLIFKEN